MSYPFYVPYIFVAVGLHLGAYQANLVRHFIARCGCQIRMTSVWSTHLFLCFDQSLLFIPIELRSCPALEGLTLRPRRPRHFMFVLI